MSDYDDPDLDLDETDKPKPNWRRDLERRADAADEAKRQAQDAQRELAFYKAGLPMDDPRMAYFVKGYDGAADADAIRKAAEGAGFIPPAAPNPAEVEAAQHRVFTEAASGATSAAALTEDDVYALARREADAAPQHLRAEVFAHALSRHGELRLPYN